MANKVRSGAALWLLSVERLCSTAGLAAEDLMQVSMDHGRFVSHVGEAPSATTLEASGDGLAYHVLDGTELASLRPRLVEFYRDLLLRELRSLTGEPLVPQASERGSISLNRISSANSRYELHIDESSYTAVLFLNTLSSGDGGELEFEGTRLLPSLSIRPIAYGLVLFDGTDWPHRIAPMIGARPRCSVVMNYWRKDELQVRPERLDDYLYG